ncbi:hypothetical protein ABEB36_006395 [Hypothenemus hampei]|uniref:Supervillin n=1 Tax=Hypothenemus hampei TaxID=57062 RepID=A0ABD1EQE8_HYPHA
MSESVKQLLIPNYSEPTFAVNFYKIARPSAENVTDPFTNKIFKTNGLNCWKITDGNLQKFSKDKIEIFFDAECYLVQWQFDLKVDNTVFEEMLVYYWKGLNANKGPSPLPPEIEDTCPVERVVQYSEPAIFFYTFPNRFVVFAGKENNFNSDAPHLLLIRGELEQEIHLYEVPCKRESLRTRAVFLLVLPREQRFIYWQGKHVDSEHKNRVLEIVQPHKILCRLQKNWTIFSTDQTLENKEPLYFKEAVVGEAHCELTLYNHPYTPRLFYLNSITGTFLATEIEYPLRAKNHIAPYPFLQSHLYTATQPALFVLDNYSEVWLWEGPADLEQIVNYEEELRMANEFVIDYIKSRSLEIGKNIQLKRAKAGDEPLEFTLLFPFWIDSN